MQCYKAGARDEYAYRTLGWDKLGNCFDKYYVIYAYYERDTDTVALVTYCREHGKYWDDVEPVTYEMSSAELASMKDIITDVMYSTFYDPGYFDDISTRAQEFKKAE